MSDIEENSKDVEEGEPTKDIQKTKKPRSEKQLKALADAREKRRVNVEVRKDEKAREQAKKDSAYKKIKIQNEIKQAKKVLKKAPPPSSSDDSDSSSDEEIVVKKKKRPTTKKKKKPIIVYSSSSDESVSSDDDVPIQHSKQHYTSGLSSYNFA